MEGGFEAPAKRKLGEGSGAVGGVDDAVGGEGGSVAAGGGSGAVARHGGSGSRDAGGSRGGWSDPAAAATSAEVIVPKKKKKNWKTQTERELPSMKLGLRAPAFEEFVDADPSEEEPDDEVDDDKESRDKKSRHVLNQLRQGRWDFQPAVGKYSCPFCKTMKTTDYDWMVAHAIGIGSDGNGRAAHVRAKHAAYGVFLQRMN